MEDTQDFLFWPKKRTRFTNKKIRSLNALKAISTTEVAEVKRAGGNEKIARFDHSVRSSVTWNILEQGFNRARLFCFTHSFNDLICYLSDLFLPNGCSKFRENKANRVEKHDHFDLQMYCWVIAPAGFWPIGQNPRKHHCSPRVNRRSTYSINIQSISRVG